MRKGFVGLTAALVLLAAAAPSFAEVNCKLVQKDMSMGRTAEDIAERMGASVEDVKKCASDANAGGAAAPYPRGGIRTMCLPRWSPTPPQVFPARRMTGILVLRALFAR